MNLDDLMEVWKSQDASPLHGMDNTMLHLALRQEQANLQNQRRVEDAFAYVLSALLVVVMGLCLAIMINSQNELVPTVWDYAVPVVGAAAALVLGSVMYVHRRAQAAREKGFGDSLRDRLRRRIAQLDDQATRERRLALVFVAVSLICGLAIYIAVRRIGGVDYSERWPVVTSLIFLVAVLVGIRRRRRAVQQDILPRKHRLEALLKELDDQE